MTTIDRRKILFAWATACAGLLVPRRGDAGGPTTEPVPAATIPTEPEVPKGPSPQYAEALQRILGGKEAKEEKVTVEIPEAVENGNIVPYKLDVQGATSPEFAEGNETIERLYLLSTRNPQALVATFQFTPLSGKPAVSGRMRLAKSQDVVAVAATSAGNFLIGRRKVEVAIDGCGNE